jgi:hypothetical protein
VDSSYGIITQNNIVILISVRTSNFTCFSVITKVESPILQEKLHTHIRKRTTYNKVLLSTAVAKNKAVPLHATKVLGWRGGIAPTLSQPRHEIGMSGQRYAPSALYLQKVLPLRYPLYRELGGPQSWSEYRG